MADDNTLDRDLNSRTRGLTESGRRGKNPIGEDGFPMERHHPGRLEGPTELILKTVHDFIHQDERDAVKKILDEDGLSGQPGKWTGKGIEPT